MMFQNYFSVFRDFNQEPSIVKKAIMRKDLLEVHFPKYFAKFQELLDLSGGEWIAGPTLTYADLALANFIDVAEEMVNPDCLKDFPDLKRLKESIFEIPQVKEWTSTTRKAGTMGKWRVRREFQSSNISTE